jgi:hypothetical protein
LTEYSERSKGNKITAGSKHKPIPRRPLGSTSTPHLDHNGGLKYIHVESATVNEVEATSKQKSSEIDIAFCGNWMDHNDPGLAPASYHTTHIKDNRNLKSIQPFSHGVITPGEYPGYLGSFEDPLLAELANL